MTTLVSSTAYAAAKFMASSGHTIKRSHISEVLAAMLGYQTYAALVVEENDSDLGYHLDDAEMLVLNQFAGEQRARTLGIDTTSKLIEVCFMTLKSTTTARVYKDVNDFYDSYGRQALAEAISSSGDVSSTMAETNADFYDDPDLPVETPQTENLWEARSVWEIAVEGTMHGSHDIESDRMFTGNTLDCYSKLTFDKAGRAGLIATDSEGYARVDDSWRLADLEDEAAYMASLEGE